MKGSECHWSSGPVGTTSVWPANTNTGEAVPRRSQRFVTPFEAIVSAAKTERCEPLGDERLAAVVLGGDGTAADQLLGEVERGVHRGSVRHKSLADGAPIVRQRHRCPRRLRCSA